MSEKEDVNKKDDVVEQVIDFRQIGATGLERFSGFIYEEFLPELVGQQGIAIYKEMGDNDPTISAFLGAIDSLCRRVPWRVQPASQEAFDIEAAEFVEQCMNDMDQTWIDTIGEILSFVQYGHSLHEINYKRRCGDGFDPTMRSKYTDGRIGWRGFPIRSQDTLWRWMFDDHGGIQGVEQIAPPHYYRVVIPSEKSLLFRTTIKKNNPEGRSVLRGAYRPWYMKKNIEQIEAIGIERDLAGLPVALVPPELLSKNASHASKALLQEIKTIVTNIRRDEQEGVIFPTTFDANGKALYELKLLSTGGSRQFDTDKVIQRYDHRIAMTALADFLLLGQNSVGSFALSSSKMNMFTAAIGAYLDIIAETFNRFAIPRLFALNDFQISDFPKIMHGDLENVDLKEIGEYLKNLAAAGMPLFPNEELEKHLMKIAHLPENLGLAADIDNQVEPGHKLKPDKITEIPDNPKQQPSQDPSPSDTTPVNDKPPLKTVTNRDGDTEDTVNKMPNDQFPNQKWNKY